MDRGLENVVYKEKPVLMTAIGLGAGYIGATIFGRENIEDVLFNSVVFTIPYLMFNDVVQKPKDWFRGREVGILFLASCAGQLLKDYF